MNYSPEEINKILSNYTKKKEYEKQRYMLIKDTDDFKVLNRQRSKAHYDKHKDIKLQNYQDNKEVMNAKSSYRYYKKVNKLELFAEKNKEKYELLKSINYI
tara:strand:+ start:38 stop:340 length:303 start_codon:yes stop_codon:yes gene_type:complete